MSDYSIYKEQILHWCKWLNENGFFGTKLGSGGNISMRIPGEDTIAVTPSSLPYKDMKIEDICIVDFNQKVREGGQPTLELSMHLSIYKKRPETGAVVHTHQLYASILSVMNIETALPVMFDEIAFSIGDEIAFIPYSLSGSPELAAYVESALSNRGKCYIMKNHGALALGKNLEQACLYAEMLEKVARICYSIMISGKNISLLPHDITHVVQQLFGRA